MKIIRKVLLNPIKYSKILYSNIFLGMPLLYPKIHSNSAVPINSKIKIIQYVSEISKNTKGISIRFATYERVNNCDIVVNLYDRDSLILFAEKFNGMNLVDNSYYYIAFPDYVDFTKTGSIEILSSDGFGINQIAVWLKNDSKNTVFLKKNSDKIDSSPLYSIELQKIVGASIDIIFDHQLEEKKTRTFIPQKPYVDLSRLNSNFIYVIGPNIHDCLKRHYIGTKYVLQYTNADEIKNIDHPAMIIVSDKIDYSTILFLSRFCRENNIPVVAAIEKNSQKILNQNLSSCVDAVIGFKDISVYFPQPYFVIDNNLEMIICDIHSIYQKIMLPKVSIVTIYDCKKDSAKLVIQSYLSQDYKGKIEVILIDDFDSLDPDEIDSFNRNASYNKKNNITFRAIKNEHNMGNCYSRNKGISESNGDIIIVIDFDCFINSNFVAAHASAHRYYDCEVVIGPCNIESCERDPSKLMSEFEKYPSKVIENCELQTSIYLESFLNCITRNFSINKSIITEDLFDLQFTYSKDPESGFGWEDVEMGYRLYKKGAGIKFTEDAISIHISHSSTVPESEKPKKSIKNFKKLVVKHPELASIASIWFSETLSKLNTWSKAVDKSHYFNKDLIYLNNLNSSPIIDAVNIISKRPLRILTYRWHVPHQYELYKTMHEFYLVKGAGTPFCNEWEYSQRPFPSNARFKNIDEIHEKDYDLALLHFDENVINYENTNGIIGPDWGATFRWFMDNIKIPKIAVCHGTPQFYGQYNFDYDKPDLLNTIQYSRNNLVEYLRDVEVVCNSYQAQREWSFAKSRVIWHGFDPCEFLPATYSKGILSPNGPLVKSRPHYRGYFLYKEVFSEKYPKEYLPQSLFVPEPDIDYENNLYAIYKYKNYINAIRQYSIYFNPTLRSPMPRARAEPMMCGVVTVNANNHDVDIFIKNGINGFYSNDPEELREYLIFLMRNEDTVRKIGAESRKTAINTFNLKRYLNDWHKLLQVYS